MIVIYPAANAQRLRSHVSFIQDYMYMCILCDANTDCNVIELTQANSADTWQLM